MSWSWATPGSWLLHSAAGGGLLLLLTWALLHCFSQPARRQRLAEWGVGAALLLAVLSLGPPWLATLGLDDNSLTRFVAENGAPCLQTGDPGPVVRHSLHRKRVRGGD